MKEKEKNEKLKKVEFEKMLSKVVYEEKNINCIDCIRKLKYDLKIKILHNIEDYKGKDLNTYYYKSGEYTGLFENDLKKIKVL